jgi:uncharacterized ion transporter superfamily protein YfcC
VVIFCADNGVAEEGVTQTDSSVTAVVTENFAKGIASVNRMAFVAGAADLIGVGFIIGISRGITVLMDGGQITDTVLYWGERALEGAGSVAFILLVYLIYIPLSVLIPSSSGLATLSVPILAPLGEFAGIGGSLIVTAFQSASGLVNIVTPTAAVVMGGLALGEVPYDRWVRFVWKLILIFFLLTLAFLAVSAIL